VSALGCASVIFVKKQAVEAGSIFRRFEAAACYHKCGSRGVPIAFSCLLSQIQFIALKRLLENASKAMKRKMTRQCGETSDTRGLVDELTFDFLGGLYEKGSDSLNRQTLSIWHFQTPGPSVQGLVSSGLSGYGDDSLPLKNNPWLNLVDSEGL
jgi:hypothetical protein